MENAASRFGQHLAHTEKKYRDRALKKLTVYLTKKKEWTTLEWDKLWKALFYCMWMSDKRPVQEELSSNLAALVHRIPSTDLALDFVHSFFRTIHREWHGLDGLRLDKFYSLVRKFVHETVVLLRVQNWEEMSVQQFVTISSAEVVSQLPNGPRMHLADLYLREIYNAAGKDITSMVFVTLLEPFLTLLSSEFDRTVFKRVRELVFEEMLTKYKFRPQLEKREEEEKEETDKEEDDDEEEHKVFEKVDLALVQHRIFDIASADDTTERNRSALYTLYKKFFTITRVDSLQVAQEEATKPKNKALKTEKNQKEEKEGTIETVQKITSDEKYGAENMETAAKVDAEGEMKIEAVEKETMQTASVKKKARTQKAATEAKVKDIEMTMLPAEIETGKKQKKMKHETQEMKDVETKLLEKEPATGVNDKKLANEPNVKKERAETKEAYVTVTKSGIKLKRCGSCGGFGKGFMPNDKNICGHCERSRKSGKKKAVSTSKKRKAEHKSQTARKKQEKAESSKKVTFGKSKALPHAVSIKRLKASAQRDAVSKDMDNIKGVLKVNTLSPVPSKKSNRTKTIKERKRAADFVKNC